MSQASSPIVAKNTPAGYATSGSLDILLTIFIWHANVSEYGTRSFYGGGRTRIEIQVRRCKNSWHLSAFSYWGASGI